MKNSITACRSLCPSLMWLFRVSVARSCYSRGDNKKDRRYANLTDTVDLETRRRTMAAVKSSNTVPEIRLRKALHARGLRYRLQVKGLAGKPDLVFPKHNAVVFVHGCFWHGHDCGACRIPQTNTDYWRKKIAGNVERDTRNLQELSVSGWRIAIVWECALRGQRQRPLEELSQVMLKWFRSNKPFLELRGVMNVNNTGKPSKG